MRSITVFVRNGDVDSILAPADVEQVLVVNRDTGEITALASTGGEGNDAQLDEITPVGWPVGTDPSVLN